MRQRVESVLAWAPVSGYRTGDIPALRKGHLDHLLPKPSKVQKKEHFAALPHIEIGAFIQSLRSLVGIAPLATDFTILTACRTGEFIGVRWEEFDQEKGFWTVPPNA